jgi:Transposase IS116/IS110/IS902 family
VLEALLPWTDRSIRHYGIGPLTSITILAELGDARRFSSSREAVRYAGMDITVHQSDTRRAPGHLSRQGPRRCSGGCLRPPNAPAGPLRPTTSTTSRRPRGSEATAPVSRSRARCSSAATTRCENSARTPWRPADARRLMTVPGGQRDLRGVVSGRGRRRPPVSELAAAGRICGPGHGHSSARGPAARPALTERRPRKRPPFFLDSRPNSIGFLRNRADWRSVALRARQTREAKQ